MEMAGVPVVAGARPDAALPRAARDWPFAWILLGCWLLGCLILVAANRAEIASLTYPDPDDQLRLVEVRDWLGGQSWWDVTQYRMNPPFGGPMHWSRLIDLPIAAVILPLRPLLGYAAAQTVAAVAVPLVTLGFCMAMVALLARRLIGREGAILAALLTTASPGALQQMRPLRVDHHGWQIGLAVAVVVALLDRRPLRSGLVAGALLALWLRISLEGLPLAAAAGALVGLRWGLATARDEDARLCGFFSALALGSLFLFAAFIPASAWPVTWCDSLSVQHLAMFGTAALGSLALVRLPARRNVRIAAGAALAAACLGVLHLGAPRCGLDAFSDLEPIVRTIWYDNVLEGLPLWRQAPIIDALALGYPLVGLFGGVLAWRTATGEGRALWRDYILLFAATMAATVLVQRIGSTANTLALPGGVYLLLGSLRRIRVMASPLLRVPATVGALLLLAPVTPGLAALALLPANGKGETGAPHPACPTASDLRALAGLPPSRLLAPLDIGPAILLDTPHSVAAGAYHRNHAAIADVIRFYAGRADGAHAIAARRGIDYVVLCRQADEIAFYRRYGSHGLGAALADGHPPAWLRPVPLPGGDRLGIWRVTG